MAHSYDVMIRAQAVAALSPGQLGLLYHRLDARGVYAPSNAELVEEAVAAAREYGRAA